MDVIAAEVLEQPVSRLYADLCMPTKARVPQSDAIAERRLLFDTRSS